MWTNICVLLRNLLVHEGNLEDFTLNDGYQIKSISEGAINFLFGHVNRFRNMRNLEAFYQNIGQKDWIDEKIRVLKYIKKI